MPDNKLPAANYLLTFFDDIETVTNNAAIYIDVISEMKARYSEESLKNRKGIAEEDIPPLIANIQQIKMTVFRAYVKFAALSEKIPEFMANKEIRKRYEAIADKPVPLKADVEAFVLELNKVFVMGVMDELLIKAADVVKGLTANA